MNILPIIKNPYFNLILLLFFITLFTFALLSSEITFAPFNHATFDLRIIVMFLLAEPHFAMTIPLLWGYRKLFYTDKFSFILVPIIIIILSCFLFYINIGIYSYLFLMANIYHVNRQSRGIMLIQGKVKLETANLYEATLHIFCVIIFINKLFIFNNSFIITLFLFCLVFILSIMIFYFDKSNLSITKILIPLQGYLIFLPVAFFDDILLAFAVGISIHYIQYLSISFAVCKKSFGFSILHVIIFLFIYSVITSSSLGGLVTNDKLSIIILIPTTLQLLHFYFDGLIWRKSNTIVRNQLNKAFL